MKKFTALLLVLLMLPTLAFAEDLSQYPTASAVVEAGTTLYVTAPFSGTLEDFDWAAGDAVSLNETLFTYETQKVYAPFNGTLAALFVQKGDDATAAASRYGMAAAIESEHPYLIQATTATAYDKSENKFIHAGELLYYKSTDNSRIKGTGRVIAVTSAGYTVEVLTGDPEIAESVNLYRDSDYIKESKVGKGRCLTADPIPVQAAGRVVKVHASQGKTVKTGDILLETLAQDAAPTAELQVKAPKAGVVISLSCAPGQQVYKGQLLATLGDTSNLILTAQVDEVDVSALTVGSTVTAVLDSQPDTTYQATVTEISQSGIQKQNASYYRVELSLPQVKDLRLGMNATVYLTK
ncbi:MAG: HlyD family efflux transporter periplasmic adaptor subunit [Clostridia bacterium]|nr:HlyD family efflux transporter periplasmic adaptor subunit [Clostridia bacterium]